jgi:spermidine synthase
MTPRSKIAFSALVAIPFMLSGFTALVYQTVLNKLLGCVFGVGSYAVATVLATFMIGLAAGSALVGRLTTSFFRRHVLWYGVFELAIGATGLVLIPLGLRAETLLAGASPARLFALRCALALGLVGLPTLLMGGSLPLLMEGIQRRGLRHRINLLYALNLCGACAGALLAAYLLLPALGLDGALRLVFALDVGVLVVAALAERLFPAAPAAPVDHSAPAPAAPLPRFILVVAFLSGYITFANEVIWTHMLSLVVGMSTYAYAIMLFTTLLGMAAAGMLVQRLARRRLDHRRFLALAQLLLGASIVLTMGLWDDVPQIFLKIGFVLTSFTATEAARFVACFALIAIPAFAAGLSFPAVLDYAEVHAPRLGASVGRLYAVNTVGTVLGALVTGFVVLGALGGRHALFLSALVSLALAAFLGARTRRGWLLAGATAGLVWGLGLWLAPGWDTKALLSGANVYFAQAHDDIDEVVWQKESYVGGVTSVIRSGKILTLLTNGKFEGNNGSEVRDQTHFALIPNLFVHTAGRALNIGLGTGTTLGAIARFPYHDIDAVELSPHVVTAADAFFGDVNGGAVHAPNVHVAIDDGRSFLLLHPAAQPYDLITVEITSIWFAGAGNLYNDEFYAVVARNLAPGGVFQQWIQLHHMDPHDIAVILKTLRRHFKHVQLWIPGHQGIVIASDTPLRLDPARLAEAAAAFPADAFDFGARWTLLGDLVMADDAIDGFIAAEEKRRPVPLSTDLNLHLEYSTPRGNALGWNFSTNFEALDAYAKPDLAALLPADLAGDPKVRALALAGRAHLFPRDSLAWHRQLNAALEALPTVEAKQWLKAQIVAALGAGQRP